jgi:hypothetical protein
MIENQHQFAANRRWNEARKHGPLNVDLMEASGKSHSTFYRHKKEGPPKRKSKPWAALGMSKSTYYYRLNKNKPIGLKPSEPSTVPSDGGMNKHTPIENVEDTMNFRDIPGDVMVAAWEAGIAIDTAEDIQPTVKETFVHHPRKTMELPDDIEAALREYNARKAWK